jgi:hypothetical protein
MLWLTVAAGLLFSFAAQAREPDFGESSAARHIELCEAFPWDEPVEQTFTVDAVSRWRRGATTARWEPLPGRETRH